MEGRGRRGRKSWQGESADRGGEAGVRRGACGGRGRGGLAPPLLGLALAVLAAGACGAGGPGIPEVYLRGTSGPYRGRVLDAATKQPLAGAVVLAVWYQDVPALVQTNERYYDALEVLTDAQGYFTVDAPAIERRAPWGTRFPIFTIFKPGYRYYRGWFASEKAMAARADRPLLGVVELQPIAGRGRQERLRNAGVRPGDVPNEKMPSLLRAMEQESQELRYEQ